MRIRPWGAPVNNDATTNRSDMGGSISVVPEQLPVWRAARRAAERACRSWSGVSCCRSSPEEVRGDGPGEDATAQEVLVVPKANAIADAGDEARSLEVAVLDPAALGLLVGTGAPGNVGDSQQLVGARHVSSDGLQVDVRGHVAHLLER